MGARVVSSGGQFAAQSPLQVDVVVLSASKRYTENPLPSTRICPSLFDATPTVAGGGGAVGVEVAPAAAPGGVVGAPAAPPGVVELPQALMSSAPPSAAVNPSRFFMTRDIAGGYTRTRALTADPPLAARLVLKVDSRAWISVAS